MSNEITPEALDKVLEYHERALTLFEDTMFGLSKSGKRAIGFATDTIMGISSAALGLITFLEDKPAKAIVIVDGQRTKPALTRVYFILQRCCEAIADIAAVAENLPGKPEVDRLRKNQDAMFGRTHGIWIALQAAGMETPALHLPQTALPPMCNDAHPYMIEAMDGDDEYDDDELEEFEVD